MNPSPTADQNERPDDTKKPTSTPASIDDQTAREISEDDDTPG